MKPSDSVILSFCDARHTSLHRWLFGSIALLTLLAGSVAYLSSVAVARSDRAMDQASDVKHAFGKHAAAQVQETKRIEQTLSRLESGMHEQRGMLEDIWKHNSNGGS